MSARKGRRVEPGAGRETVTIAQARAPRRACPVCVRVLDAVTALSLRGADPRPVMRVGDLTCCAYCKTPLVLTVFATFAPASAAEITRIAEPLRSVWLLFLEQPPQ